MTSAMVDLHSNIPRPPASALSIRQQGRVDSDSDANGIVVKPSSAAADSDSKEVDAERGSPLPEHTRESDKALSLLRRVERCCLESKSGEVEAVVASLSSYMDGTGTHGSKSDDEAGIAVECFGALSSGKKAEGAGLVVDAALGACRAALQLCRGEYEELIRETALFSSFSSPPAERSGDCVDGAGGDVVKTCVRAFVTHTQGVNSGDVNVADDANTAAAIWRAAEAMWAGAAALSLFLQENYSGPELGTERKGKLDAWFGQIIQGSGQNGAETSGAIAPSGASAGIVATRGEGQELANMALACDGELPYPQSGLAGALFLGRTILKTLVDVSPDAVGGSAKGQKEEDATFLKAAGSLSSVSWWSARACVAHARLLLSPGRSETLWIEAVSLFGRAVQSFGGGVGQEERDEGKDREGAEGKQGRRDNVRRKMGGQVWLEWGLAQHHFQVRGYVLATVVLILCLRVSVDFFPVSPRCSNRFHIPGHEKGRKSSYTLCRDGTSLSIILASIHLVVGNIEYSFLFLSMNSMVTHVRAVSFPTFVTT